MPQAVCAELVSSTHAPPQHRCAAEHCALVPHWHAPDAEQLSDRSTSHVPPHEAQFSG
jgi:hypothetical protein